MITFKNINAFKYNINNIDVNTVQNHKHIGVIYDSKMLFISQIDIIIEKSLKMYKKILILYLFNKNECVF